MDKVYVEENNLSLKCDEFDRYKRKPEQNMKEFIHLYEQKITEPKVAKVEFPEIVLANKILRAANVLPSHYLIVRSSCTEMTLENAKKALLRITEKYSGPQNQSENMIQVKTEMLDADDSVLYAENDLQHHNEFDGIQGESEEVLVQSGRTRHNPYAQI